MEREILREEIGRNQPLVVSLDQMAERVDSPDQPRKKTKKYCFIKQINIVT